jgi:hypothetical protein
MRREATGSINTPDHCRFSPYGAQLINKEVVILMADAGSDVLFIERARKGAGSAAGRTGQVLVCHFVGQEEKPGKRLPVHRTVWPG